MLSLLWHISKHLSQVISLEKKKQKQKQKPPEQIMQNWHNRFYSNTHPKRPFSHKAQHLIKPLKSRTKIAVFMFWICDVVF